MLDWREFEESSTSLSVAVHYCDVVLSYHACLNYHSHLVHFAAMKATNESHRLTGIEEYEGEECASELREREHCNSHADDH